MFNLTISRNDKRHRAAILTALVLFIVPWTLYFAYLKILPLYPTNQIVHLYWSKDGTTFDKTHDHLAATKQMTGKTENFVFRFPNATTFKQLRIDPMNRINGVITLYSLQAFNAAGNKVLDIDFGNERADWSTSDCYPDPSDIGWKIKTHGALVLASPVLPETIATRIELQFKAIPLDKKMGFLSWLVNII